MDTKRMALDYGHTGRVYVWQTVPVEDSDRGANDEGYYWEWCDRCGDETEHEEDGCLNCGGVT